MKATLKVTMKDGDGAIEAGFEFDLENRKDLDAFHQMRERIESSDSIASSPRQFFYQIQHVLPKEG